jgi:hypothetical protein
MCVKPGVSYIFINIPSSLSIDQRVVLQLLLVGVCRKPSVGAAVASAVSSEEASRLAPALSRAILTS